MTSTAIVILNYNGRDYLQKFLPSVIQFSNPHRVIVVDNASTDDSVQLLKESFPQVELMELGENNGFSKGYNIALKEISADYYMILNSDVEVTDGWLDPMIRYLDENPEVAATQPKIIAEVDKQTFEYAGAAGGFVDYLGYPFCRGRMFLDLEKDQGQYNDDIDIFWASGACFLIRSQVFHELGGFDDDFFAHMEEIDLCWRIHHASYRIRYISNSVVYHVGGGTLPKSNPRKTYLNFRNGLTLLYKNLPMYQLLFRLPVRLLFDLVAIVKFFFADSPAHSWSVIKAVLSFLFTPGRNIRRRRDTVKRTGLSKTPPLFRRSIVVDYYILGKKKFSDLGFSIPTKD